MGLLDKLIKSRNKKRKARGSYSVHSSRDRTSSRNHASNRRHRATARSPKADEVSSEGGYVSDRSSYSGHSELEGIQGSHARRKDENTATCAQISKSSSVSVRTKNSRRTSAAEGRAKNPRTVNEKTIRATHKDSRRTSKASKPATLPEHAPGNPPRRSQAAGDLPKAPNISSLQAPSTPSATPIPPTQDPRASTMDYSSSSRARKPAPTKPTTNTKHECGTCFGDADAAQMTHCSARSGPHWFCLRCARAQAETLVGQSRWDLRCMSTTGCRAGFARAQVERFAGAATLARLDALHFVSGTRNVPGLEGLVECPFCEFRALVDPLDDSDEATWWFFCLNAKCSEYSCRLCKEKWHPGRKCGAADKEKKLDVRHLVEEAMSEAMIQKCNSCKARFIKEVGCNKMTCTDCGNLQCYLCKESISGPEHYHQIGSKCQLFMNDAARHVDDVKAAERAAIEKVLKDHPELTREDLKVEMSAKVKADEKLAIKKGARPELLILEEDLALGRDPFMAHDEPPGRDLRRGRVPPQNRLNPGMQGRPVFDPHRIGRMHAGGYGAPARGAYMGRHAIRGRQNQPADQDEELARRLHEQFLDDDHAARQMEEQQERRDRARRLRLARSQQILMPPPVGYGQGGYGGVGLPYQAVHPGYGGTMQRQRRRVPQARPQWPGDNGFDDFDGFDGFDGYDDDGR